MKNFFLWGWVLLFDPEILKSGTFQSPNQSKQQGWLHLLSPPFTRWEANQYNSHGIFLNHKFNKILVFLWNVNTTICNFLLKTVTVENSQTIQQPILLKTSIQKRSTEWPWKLGEKFPTQLNRNKNNLDRYPWRRSKRTRLAPVTASGTRCSRDKMQQSSGLVPQAYWWGPGSYRVKSRSKTQPHSLCRSFFERRWTDFTRKKKETEDSRRETEDTKGVCCENT